MLDTPEEFVERIDKILDDWDYRPEAYGRAAAAIAARDESIRQDAKRDAVIFELKDVIATVEIFGDPYKIFGLLKNRLNLAEKEQAPPAAPEADPACIRCWMRRSEHITSANKIFCPSVAGRQMGNCTFIGPAAAPEAKWTCGCGDHACNLRGYCVNPQCDQFKSPKPEAVCIAGPLPVNQGEPLVRPEAVCPRCNGTRLVRTDNARMNVNLPCPDCHGKGRVQKAVCPMCKGTKIIEVFHEQGWEYFTQRCHHCNGTGEAVTPEAVCPRCENRRLITVYESRPNGGAIWNEPCPDCNGAGKLKESTSNAYKLAKGVNSRLNGVVR
jgi:hypothetical protein